MKKFFKNYFTFEPPFGEIWAVILITTTLFAFGLIESSTAAEWVFTSIALGLLFISIFFVQLLWKRKKTGILWYLYTLILTVGFLSYVNNIIILIKNDESILNSLILFAISGISTLFAFMILLDQNYFSRKFWKGVLFVEIISIPLLVTENLKIISITDPSISITLHIIIVSSILYATFISPYLVMLYRYSFIKIN